LGGSIQHYNGNLGNSLFQFKTTCFAGFTSSVNVYVNKSFDVSFGNAIGHFGYCPTAEDEKRMVDFALRCPGETCQDLVGMGNLRSQLFSSTLSLRYKFANGMLLAENARVEPYIYAGAGYNRLSDVMKRDCVNAGNHFTTNAGIGARYNLSSKWNVGYNLEMARFSTKKVYLTNEIANPTEEYTVDPEAHKMEHRKDYCMRNSIFIGFNL
jgi:opacity protein-like surface antigen